MTRPAIKQKLCKAPNCNKLFTPRFNTMQEVCSPDCGVALHRYRKIKKKARDRKAERNSRSLPHQLELTQQSFNRMMRLLDADKPCVSCDKAAGTYNLTAGHFLTVGAFPELRFDPRNCHAQCSGCNQGQQQKHKGDNATTRQKFEATLVNRYGQELVDHLKGPHTAKLYTCDHLRVLRAVFNAESRRLELGEGPSRDWRALD